MSNHRPPLSMAELLAHVFTYLELEDLLPLRLVARIWDACVLESSAFSYEIAYDTEELSEGAVQFFLLRLHARQNSPVDILVRTLDENPHLQQRLLLPIAHQLHRIRELRILGLDPAHAQYFHNALCRPAPILRKLVLDYDTDPPEEDAETPIYELPVNIFAGVAPHLVDIVLSELTLPPAPPAAFAPVEKVDFSLRIAEDLARSINPLFTQFPRMRQLLISVPFPIWTPESATALMVQGARQLEYFYASGQQAHLVRWVQGHTGGSIANITIVDDIETESLQLFIEQLAERPTDDLALVLTDPRIPFAGATVSSLSHARWERTLMRCPTDHPAWLAEWLAAPAHAPRVVQLDVHSSVWPGLCEAVGRLPNLARLRVDVGEEDVEMGEVQIDGVLECPSLREVTLVIAADADEVSDDELRAFARNSIAHGARAPYVAIQRAQPDPWSRVQN